MKLRPRPRGIWRQPSHSSSRRRRKAAQIVSTSELFCSQYFSQTENHDNFSWPEPIPADDEALSRVAAGGEIVIVGSLFERPRRGSITHGVCVDADGDYWALSQDAHSR